MRRDGPRSATAIAAETSRAFPGVGNVPDSTARSQRRSGIAGSLSPCRSAVHRLVNLVSSIRSGTHRLDQEAICASSVFPCWLRSMAAGSLRRFLAGKPGRRPPDDYVCGLTGECAEDATRKQAARRRQRTPTAARHGDPRLLAVPHDQHGAHGDAARGHEQTATAAGPRPAAASGPAGPRQPAPRLRHRLGVAVRCRRRPRSAPSPQALRRPQLATMRFRIEGHTDSLGRPRGQHDPVAAARPGGGRLLVSQGIAPTGSRSAAMASTGRCRAERRRPREPPGRGRADFVGASTTNHPIVIPTKVGTHERRISSSWRAPVSWVPAFARIDGFPG